MSLKISLNGAYLVPTAITSAPTAYPASAPHGNFSEIIFDVDTTAGDVDLTTFAAALPAGFKTGQHLQFRKFTADSNSILCVDPVRPTIALDASVATEMITLVVDSTNRGLITD